MTGTHIPDPYSPLYTLANLSVDLLNDATQEDISTPVRDVNPNNQVLDAKDEELTKEEDPL